MTQIIFKASTVAIGVEDTAATAANALLLPLWAPPIEWIDDATSGPWNAIMYKTTTSAAAQSTGPKTKRVHIFAYGRDPAIGGGREYVSLSRAVGTHTAKQYHILTLNYRAVGEVVRP